MPEHTSAITGWSWGTPASRRLRARARVCVCVFVLFVCVCVFVCVLLANWSWWIGRWWLVDCHTMTFLQWSVVWWSLWLYSRQPWANIIHKHSVSIPPETLFVYMLKRRCLMNIWKTMVLSDTELKKYSWSNQRSCHYLIGYSPQIMSCAVDRKCATWYCASPDHIGANYYLLLSFWTLLSSAQYAKCNGNTNVTGLGCYGTVLTGRSKTSQHVWRYVRNITSNMKNQI